MRNRTKILYASLRIVRFIFIFGLILIGIGLFAFYLYEAGYKHGHFAHKPN